MELGDILDALEEPGADKEALMQQLENLVADARQLKQDASKDDAAVTLSTPSVAQPSSRTTRGPADSKGSNTSKRVKRRKSSDAMDSRQKKKKKHKKHSKEPSNVDSKNKLKKSKSHKKDEVHNNDDSSSSIGSGEQKPVLPSSGFREYTLEELGLEDTPDEEGAHPLEGEALREREKRRKLRRKRRRESTRECGGCGLSMSEGSNKEVWAASVRGCISQNWPATIHKKYFARLAVELPTAGSSVRGLGEGLTKLECPFDDCKRTFTAKSKLFTHMSRVHQSSPEQHGSDKLDPGGEMSEIENRVMQEMENEMKLEKKAKKKKITPREPLLRSASVRAATTRYRHRKAALNNQQAITTTSGNPLTVAKPTYDVEHASLGLFRTNHIGWDDSVATRIGLLPLEPPRDSEVFEKPPSQFYRLSIVDGRLSRKWNEYLDGGEDAEFGITQRQILLHEKARDELVKTENHTNDSSSSSTTRSKNNGNDDTRLQKRRRSASSEEAKPDSALAAYQLYNKRRPPPSAFTYCFGHAEGTVQGGHTFSMKKCKRVLDSCPALLHPVPEMAPAPPSKVQLEHTIWIEEAGRLLRCVENKKKKLRPFDEVILPGVEHLSTVAPGLGLLAHVCNMDDVKEKVEHLSKQNGGLSLQGLVARR